MVARCHDLLEIFLHLLLLVYMGNCQRRKAHNGIHGRADIMGHIGQKQTLSLAGPVCLHQGILQQALLFHLAADFLIHAAESQNNAVVPIPLARTDYFYLVILCLVVYFYTVIRMILKLFFQFLSHGVQGYRLGKHLPVFFTDIVLYISSHALLQEYVSPESRIKHGIFILVIPEQNAFSRINVKIADPVEVDTQRPHQFPLASLVLLLLLFLGSTVQEEPLVIQLPVLFHQLHIAHDMQDIPAFVPHPVFDADAVPLIFQMRYFFLEIFPVFLQHGGGYQLKSALHQLFHIVKSQDLQGGPVNADNFLSIQRMTDHAAVDDIENRLQRTALLNQLLFIGALLGHVYGNSHGSHHASVNIVQRRLICSQRPHSLPGFDHLLGDECSLFRHHFTFRFNARRIILLHVPYVCVALSLDLCLCLIDRPAETVIHLFVYAVFIFIPDQVGDIVDGGLKKVACLPEILFTFIFFLPSQKAEPDLLL